MMYRGIYAPHNQIVEKTFVIQAVYYVASVVWNKYAGKSCMGYVKSMKNKKVFFLTAVWGLKQSGYAKSLNMCSKYLTVIQSTPIIYTTDYGIAGLPCMWL